MKFYSTRICTIFIFIRLAVTSKKPYLYRCNNSEYTRQFYVCDGIDDCSDKSDEANCPNDCSNHNKYFKCSESCISNLLFCDKTRDCNTWNEEICCNGSDSTCKKNMNKNPIRLINVSSKRDQECKNKYRCTRGPKCISLREVCDGVNDCEKFHDDEKNCKLSCPKGCRCDMGFHDCSNIGIERIPLYKNDYEEPRTLDISRNILITVKTKWFLVNENPVVTNNHLWHIMNLNFSRNSIYQIERKVFDILRVLRYLDLSHNPLSKLLGSDLSKLQNLQYLDLSFTNIKTLNLHFLTLLPTLNTLKFSGTKVTTVDLRVLKGKHNVRNIYFPHYAFCCKLKQLNGVINPINCSPDETKLSSCNNLLKLPHFKRLLLALAIILFIVSFGHWNYVYRWEKDETQRLLMLNFSSSLFFIAISSVLQVANIRLNKPVINDEFSIISSAICKASNVFFILGYVSGLLINIVLSIYSVSLPTGLFRTQLNLKKKYKIALTFIWLISLAYFISSLTNQGCFKTYFAEIDSLCSPLNILMNSRNNAYIFSLTLIPLESILFSLISLSFSVLALGWRFYNIRKAKQSLRVKAKKFKDSEDVYNLWTDAVFDAKSDDVELVSSFVSVSTLYSVVMIIFGICAAKVAADGQDSELYPWITQILLPIAAGLSSIVYISVDQIEMRIALKDVFTKRTFSVFRRAGGVSVRIRRQYVTLPEFVKKKSELTVREALFIARNTIWIIRHMHKQSQVCDKIGPEYLMVITDHQEEVKDTDLTCGVEYPKMDVHDWRKKRDIGGYGKMITHLIEQGNFVTAMKTPRIGKFSTAVQAKSLVTRISRKLSRRKIASPEKKQRRNQRTRRTVRRKSNEEKATIEVKLNNQQTSKELVVKDKTKRKRKTNVSNPSIQNEKNNIAIINLDEHQEDQQQQNTKSKTSYADEVLDNKLKTLSADKLKQESYQTNKPQATFLPSKIPDILENTIEIM
ncbi:DgyrCDS8616 [Dimorphilus gyrociliatus]|uniref:DgyrCDS8616 n=1 Tax=Dimorphilus gyrociliatus TaxID=2664684 RepID=A0A7I8VZT5_9ANNE|nr:DgyrCDS8616 [Dimorphilus gyrociliatus]